VARIAPCTVELCEVQLDRLELARRGRLAGELAVLAIGEGYKIGTDGVWHDDSLRAEEDLTTTANAEGDVVPRSPRQFKGFFPLFRIPQPI
jgi:hypothetical protein